MATANAAKTDLSTRTATKVEVSGPSRREFLYYIWGASIVLLLGQTGAALIWFALPRFKAGTLGGVFAFDPSKVPLPDTPPVNEPVGRFWISNTSEGFTALYAVCTHLGCLPKWVDTNSRFECPCHGSKFELNGKYIEGPAPRSMDRYPATLTFTNGTTATTNENGDPIPLEGRTIAKIEINTGRTIKRTGKV